jgi:uncharacterized protein (DUF58 family)
VPLAVWAILSGAAVVLPVVDLVYAFISVKYLTVKITEIVRASRGEAAAVMFALEASRSVCGSILQPAHDAVQALAPCDFSLKTGEEPARCRQEIIPLERGVFRIEAVRMMVRSPMGLWRWVGDLSTEGEIRVFANSRKEQRNMGALWAQGLSGLHLQSAVGKGREVDKLREYVHGDGIEDIHWKATARHGHPITKVYRIERSQDIYLVMDTSRFARRTIAHITVPEVDLRLPVSLLERSIVTADILAMIATRQGDRVGLVGFSRKADLFVKPGTGSEHLSRCRRALLDLSADESTIDYQELFQYLAMHIHRRALFLFMTDLDDPAAAEAFTRNLRFMTSRHIVVCICPLPPDVGPLFQRPVSTDHEIYGALSGGLRWKSIQLRKRELRAQGADLVTVSYDDMPSETIRAYMATRRRQLV